MAQPALILAENKEWEKGAAGVCWFGKPEGRRKTEDGRRKTVDFFSPMNRDTESDGLEAFRRSRKRHKPTETVAPLCWSSVSSAHLQLLPLRWSRSGSQ